MKVLWLFVCVQVGIFSLAGLCDLIWKKRKKAYAHRIAAVCQGCANGNLSVEVSGFWIHQYRDCWISCHAKNQLKMIPAEKEDLATPLAEAGVTSPQIA